MKYSEQHEKRYSGMSDSLKARDGTAEENIQKSKSVVGSEEIPDPNLENDWKWK